MEMAREHEARTMRRGGVSAGTGQRRTSATRPSAIVACGPAQGAAPPRRASEMRVAEGTIGPADSSWTHHALDKAEQVGLVKPRAKVTAGQCHVSEMRIGGEHDMLHPGDCEVRGSERERLPGMEVILHIVLLGDE